MSRAYYPVHYRLDHEDRWLIWHTDSSSEGLEPDGVFVGRTGSVIIFRTQQGLAAYTKANDLLPLEAGNSVFYNFDAVEKWLKRKRPTQLSCVEFLDTWNLLADLSASVCGDFDPDKIETRKIYSKLFWGSNLPAVTPHSKHYDLVWPGRESRVIRQVLKNGLFLFRHCVAQVKPEFTSSHV